MSAPVALSHDEPSDHAFAAVLTGQLAQITANFSAAISGQDPERLHDLRVAVRRTRTAQRQLRHALPAERLGWFRFEFRWLQRATGQARDLDVYVLGFDALRGFVAAPSRPALEPALEVLHRRRVSARLEMRRDLRTRRCRALVDEWRAFLQELAASEGERGAVPIGELAQKRIDKLFRRVLELGDAIDASSRPEEYHHLRKQAKELRYMLELFAAPLHEPGALKPTIKSLKAVQDTLGRHQDREVQVALLHSVRASIADRRHGGPAARAIDELVRALHDDELAARREFAGRFDAFIATALQATLADAGV